MKNMKMSTKVLATSLALCYGLLFFSCQKDEAVPVQVDLARVVVINAVVSGPGEAVRASQVKANVSTKEVDWSSIPDYLYLGDYQPSKLFNVLADQPTVMQVVPLADPSKFWYKQEPQLSNGKVYTLYFSGTPSAMKIKFQEEVDVPYEIRDPKKPATSADSVVNIRFINLSPSGPKLDINILNSSTKEATNLAYEEFTEFKAYPAVKGADYLNFEIRDATDKKVLRSYRFNASYNRFKTIAIMIRGIYGNASLPYESQYGLAEVPYQ